MPVDEIYWNSIDFGSEEESLSVHEKNYVDPWDLENYAYIRNHLDSEQSSDDFVPNSLREHQGYAAIDEVRRRPSRRRTGDESLLSTYSEFGDNSYETNVKDFAHQPFVQKDRWRRVPNYEKTGRDRSQSFSYGDYGNQDIYCKLDEIRPKRELSVPIYDDIKRQPRIGLSNYGHLKIDYSYSWSNLNKYICN